MNIEQGIKSPRQGNAENDPRRGGCGKPYKGFSNLKDGRSYDDLYQSALCRAKADWLVGINATRLFSILYHKTLNVGRVQTPTLTMLVNRDYAISSFKKEKYHVVRLDAGGVSALSERLNDEAAAQQMKAACEKSQAVCSMTGMPSVCGESPQGA